MSNNEMTVREIARMCDITPQYVHQLIKDKNIPYRTYGKINIKLVDITIVKAYFSKYLKNGDGQ